MEGTWHGRHINDTSTTQYMRPVTRGQLARQYRAAGILPYALHADTPDRTPRVVVLLGGERNPGLQFKDFGGRREPCDGDSPIATAAREFAEETLGMFGGGCDVTSACIAASARTMAATLHGGALHTTHRLRSGHVYVMYAARVPFLEPLFLQLASQALWYVCARLLGPCV